MIQFASSYFCAAVSVSDSGKIVSAAPILRYMVGWSRERALSYARGKRWNVLYDGPR